MIKKELKQLCKKILSFSACLFATGLIFAQEIPVEKPVAGNNAENENIMVLTIDDAINYAAEHSLTLKTSALDLELAKWKSDTSWNTFLPSVSVTGVMSRSNEVSNMVGSIMDAMGLPNTQGDPTESQHWTAMGNLSVQFSFNAAMLLTMKSVKESYEGGKITYEQAVRSNEDSIRKLFYALLLQQESLKLQKDSLENARQRMAQASVNYQNGYVPQIQYLQSQVSYENMVPSVEKAELSMRQSLDTFSFLIGLPVGTKIELKGEINPVYVEVDVEDLIEKAKENNLSIKSVKQSLATVKLSKTALDLSTYTPSLAISWGAQPVITNAFDKDWGNKDNWSDNGSLSFSLVWNLTNMLPWSSSRSTVKELSSSIEKIELSLQTLERNTELEVRKAVDNLNQCRRSIEISERNIGLAQKSYDMTWLAYKNGTSEYLNLVEAQTQLNQAKLGLISEKYNYMNSLMELETLINSSIAGDR